MKKIILLISACALLTSCSLLSKSKKSSIKDKGAAEIADIKQRAALERGFNEALAFMDLGEYKKAGRKFKILLKKFPNSDMELLIIYNLGGALEGLNRCEKGAKRYREVIQRSLGRFRKLEAQAKLRLSYTYECLGEDAKVVATLLDLQKMSSILAPAIDKAEIPARLAAAYSRLGNTYLAQSYFNQAQEGLKSINRGLRNISKKQALMSKTLYYMGNMKKHTLKKMSSQAYIDSQKYLQNYLLMSVEMDHKQWSLQAANEILASYDHIYDTLRKVAVEKEDAIGRRKVRSQRMALLEGAIANINSLRLQRFTEETEPNIVKMLFGKVAEKEKTFQLELSRTARGTELTKEALERDAFGLPGSVRPENK